MNPPAATTSRRRVSPAWAPDEALTAADAGLQLVRRLGTMLSSGIGIAEHQAEAVVRAGRWDDALALLDAFP